MTVPISNSGTWPGFMDLRGTAYCYCAPTLPLADQLCSNTKINTHVLYNSVFQVTAVSTVTTDPLGTFRCMGFLSYTVF